LSTAASCAAIRAGLTNHTDTRFMNIAGKWIAGAQVRLDEPLRGQDKLVHMLSLSIEECLQDSGPPGPGTLPVLLCVAEKARVGRLSGLDEMFFDDLSRAVGIEFHPELSAVIAHGRVSVAIALLKARELLAGRGITRVLVAAADSLLAWPTLAQFEADGRLLAPGNSNGFIAGEAAGAMILAPDSGGRAALFCTGLGFATEASTIATESPLRADGLTAAIKHALADAGCGLNDLDFRITDNSGEQYYFKEASLAYTRTARARRKEFDIWHPADSIGETGSVIGIAALAVADHACRKGYAHGPGILFHCGNDAGQRAAVVLRYGAQ
jgi:3-oxoacyl-[acyl-carrier-protein] synthase I